MSIDQIPPRIQAMPLRCSKCRHEWTGYIVVDCVFDLAIASMKALTKGGCPECGAKGNAVCTVTQS